MQEKDNKYIKCEIIGTVIKFIKENKVAEIILTQDELNALYSAINKNKLP